MRRQHRFLTALVVVLGSTPGLWLTAPSARAQFGPANSLHVDIKSPAPSQVFQRDSNGMAEVPIEIAESDKDVKVIDASVASGMAMMNVGQFGTAHAHRAESVRARQVEACRRRAVHDPPEPAKGQGHLGSDGRARLRRRPLGSGRPVEHGGRRRPDRRHAAALDGHGAGDGRQVGPGRGAAALAGRFSRPGPLGRSQGPAPSVRPSSTRRGPRGPAWACRSRRRWSSRRGVPVGLVATRPRRHEHGSSGTRPRRARGATACTARCSAR